MFPILLSISEKALYINILLIFNNLLILHFKYVIKCLYLHKYFFTYYGQTTFKVTVLEKNEKKILLNLLTFRKIVIETICSSALYIKMCNKYHTYIKFCFNLNKKKQHKQVYGFK